MTLSPQRLSTLYNRCNPDEPLIPGDDRLVDLDRPIDGQPSPRGARWAERIVRRITRASEAPQVILFSGLRGSGKTTELGRLAGMLACDGYLPAITSADDSISLDQPIDLPDLLLPLLHGTESALHKSLAPGDVMGEATRRAVLWLTARDTALAQLAVGLAYDWDQPGATSARFVADLKTNASLRDRVRKAVSANLTGFREEVRGAFLALDAQAKAEHPLGLVVILDSLEKLRGTGGNDAAVFSSLQRLFTSGEQYLQLPVHALYTVPPELLLRLRAKVDFIPMVKLHDLYGNRHEPGYAAMRSLVEHRVGPDDLRALFGADVGLCVERIITASGGYPRELIRLLQEMIFAADPAVPPAEFDQVLRRAGDEVRRVVRFHAEAIDWLGSVAETRTLPTNNEEERALATRMLAESVVLRYLNDDEWWELHPAVRGMFEIVAARERYVQRERAARPPKDGRG